MAVRRLLLWGTADLGKPRTRILFAGLRAQNVVVGECLFDIWSGIEDKSQVGGLTRRLRLALRYCLAYPILVWRYCRAPRHDVVFVAYMGHLDVLILWPFAKMRGAKIVWDAFLSLYDTIVDDRKLVRPAGLRAKVIGWLERAACAAADLIVLDTKAHAKYFSGRYGAPETKLTSVWVGAETHVFQHRPLVARPGAETFNILFYGQFIPLHGIEFIIDAARRVSDPSVRWTLVGSGQERNKIDKLLEQEGAASITVVDWIDYARLPVAIAEADLCLGVFGESDKAARVIPNKVFQIIAVGRPLVTRDSPAIREIVTPETPGVWLVEPGSGAAIAAAVEQAVQWTGEREIDDLYADLRENITGAAVGRRFLTALHEAF